MTNSNKQPRHHFRDMTIHVYQNIADHHDFVARVKKEDRGGLYVFFSDSTADKARAKCQAYMDKAIEEHEAALIRRAEARDKAAQKRKANQ